MSGSGMPCHFEVRRPPHCVWLIDISTGFGNGWDDIMSMRVEVLGDMGS